MLLPTKSVLQSKRSRLLKSVCISMPFFLEYMVSILWEKFGNKPKLKTDCSLKVECVYFRHICQTLLDLPHEMSQIDDCDCAMFVSQHCSANIKASAQGSS